MVMFVMIMAAVAVFAVMMVWACFSNGSGIRLDAGDDRVDGGQQCVWVGRGDAQLPCGEGNGGMFDLRKFLNFRLHSGGAVGAAEVFENVDALDIVGVRESAGTVIKRLTTDIAEIIM